MIDDYSIEYSYQTAFNWMLQAGNALDYMHEMKFYGHIHRDIKPLNMLLDEEYRTLKLCDFGTTGIVEENKSKNLYGTEIYMAPEALKGNYTEECDFYSWAISLEHCATRKMPFSSCRNEKCFESCKNSDYYDSQISGNSRSAEMLKFYVRCFTCINPELRENFYNTLSNIGDKTSNSSDEYFIRYPGKFEKISVFQFHILQNFFLFK